MDDNVLQRLKGVGLLSDCYVDLGNVPTGSYALNKVISGKYTEGIPIGMITQFRGESSTAKTVFATNILIEAQKHGYYTVLIDSENAYNPEFAKTLGLDPERLIYAAPPTLERCFETIEDTITQIREVDKDTPIVVAYDSIAVSPAKDELETDKGEKRGYETHNMQGAIRAKVTGSCLRKINLILRDEKVALVIINQIRSKIGVMFGDPRTPAAGGKSLDYYLGVNMETVSNKSSDLIKNKRGDVVGIGGTVKNIKNKVSMPFRQCEFKLTYDEGLDPYAGLLAQFVKDEVVEQNGAWYSYGEEKFQKKNFIPFIDKHPDLKNLLEDSLESSD